MSPTRGGAKYYGLLLVLCVAAFAGITWVHWTSGRSLIWSPDGLALYYNFFVYEGEWLRGIAQSVLQGRFEVPLYSFNMGYGADVLATMGGCLNDPFNLVSAFCPPRYAEYVLEALIFVRFFLAAITFSWYSFERGRGRAVTLCGSLCYVLCGFVVFWGVLRHPNFLNFAILLPFILQGADRVMAGKAPYRLIGGFFLLFVFSLYFSYMMLVITVAYCLIAFFLGRSSHGIKDLGCMVGKFFGFILLAALLAGLVWVPLFLVLSSMGRVELERTIPLWESFRYYWEYGSALLGGNFSARGLTVGAVSVLGSAAFLAARKLLDPLVWRPWAVALFLCVAGTLVPFVGSAMNGFGYVTDRWFVVLGFCVANATALALPVIGKFKRRQWLAFGLLVAFLGCWAAAYAYDDKGAQSVVALVALGVALVLLIAFHRAAPRVLAVALSVAAIACVSATAITHNSSWGANYVDQFIVAKEARNVAQTVPFDRVDGGFDPAYRVDRGNVYGVRNQALAAGVKGIDFFSSFYNQKVDDARYELGVSSHWTNYIYNGVENRFALENLMGAKYYIVEEEKRDPVSGEKGSDADRAPYGYELAQDLGATRQKESFSLYESSLALPIAFTYKTAVSSSAFEKLGMVQRQEVLTRSCLLEDEALAVQAGVPTDISTTEQSYQVLKQEGLRFDEHGAEVSERGAKLVLEVEGIADAENYVVFDRLIFTPMSLEEQRLATGSAAVVDKETGRLATPWDELKWEAPSSTEISFKAGKSRRTLRISTSESSSYSGKVNWAVNMGYSEKARKKFVLRFTQPGYYSWDKLSVVSQPVKAIEENLKKLKEDNKASITFATNRMDVAVAPEDGADERYTFLSIPYSAGWSATMDGQPVDILKANTGFMAVAMDGAAHELVFTYCTPGLKAGAVCSLIGIVGLAALVAGRRARAKRRNKEEQAGYHD
ncbi:MAG: YfhO family protein [Adlercreutzia sp.]|nr:YfhO family protein [Adlercreutzia sp.]